MTHPLDRRRRRDKHDLAAGGGILFDPPHSRWLDRPGFRDAGGSVLYTPEPILPVTFEDPTGRERRPQATDRDRTPVEIVVTYEAGEIGEAVEVAP